MILWVLDSISSSMFGFVGLGWPHKPQVTDLFFEGGVGWSETFVFMIEAFQKYEPRCSMDGIFTYIGQFLW